MKRFLPLSFVAAICLTSLLGAPVADAGAIRSGFDSDTLARNDDGSTGLVGIGFDINFFGTTYSQLYVNNNGNVTFDNSFGTFTPGAIDGTGSAGSGPIIAPFFADVDTGGVGEPVRYGAGMVNGRTAFGVNWVDVAHYQEALPLNSFQLVLTDRSDIAPGDFDIEFNYDEIVWESGEASGSDPDGLGGTSAVAGYSNANGTFFQLPGSLVNGAFLDSNLVTGLINNSRNSPELGRYQFNARGGGIDPGVVPEPTSLAIFSMLAFTGCVRRRSRRTL